MTIHLFIGVFALHVALMAALPVLPPLAREIGLTELQTGLMISLSAFTMVVVGPFWGRLSETWGRRPVFLTGLLGIAIALLLFTLAAEAGIGGILVGTALYGALILTRIPLGAAAAAVSVAAQALVADTTTGENRSAGMAIIGAANAIGLIIGPTLAAGLVVIGLLVPLYVGAMAVFTLALVLFFIMPDPPRRKMTDADAKVSFKDGRVWPFLIVGFSSVMAITVVQMTTGFLMIDRFGYGVEDAAQYSAIAFFVAGIVLVCVQGILIPRFKWAPAQLLRTGLPLMSGGYLLLLWSPSVLGIYFAFGVIALGAGATFPGYQAAISLAVGEDEQGGVAGLTTAATSGGAVIGPLLGTGLYGIAPALVYIVGALCLFMLTLFAWRSSAVASARPSANLPNSSATTPR